MNVFGIIAHISLLVQCGKDVQSIVGNLVSKKENFPSNSEFLKLIDDAAALIGSGLIALPDDLVKKISASLGALKVELQGVA